MAANVDSTALTPPNRDSRLSVAEDDSNSFSKRLEGPPFRCPFYAVEGDEGNRRCKDWHNGSIAAVTRHALKDAGEGTEKWRAIKELSSAKLAPPERWRRYYVIFNDDTEDDPMNQPYWMAAGPPDSSQGLASILTERSPNSKQALEYAMALGDLEAERRKNLESIESEFEGREISEIAALRASLAQAKVQAKGHVDIIYRFEVDALKNRFAGQGVAQYTGSPPPMDASAVRLGDRIVSVYSTGHLQRSPLSTLIHNRATLAATVKKPVAEPDEEDGGEGSSRSPKRKRARLRATA